MCMYKHVDAGFLEDSTCDPCEFLVQLLDAQPSGSGLIPSMSRVSYYKGKNPYLFLVYFRQNLVKDFLTQLQFRE